jgi:23S rRNA (guanine1835-N2)-methyltransferase
MTSGTRMSVAQGDFELRRRPVRENDPLRAWDAADEYVLRHLAEVGVPLRERPLMVVNDTWGALSTALAATGVAVASMSDSVIAQQSAADNLQLNGIDPSTVTLTSTLDPVDGLLAAVVIRIPKSLSLLEHQLHVLAPNIDADTVVVATGMTKDIHLSTLALLDRIIGPTRTSLAVRKARLAFTVRDPLRDHGADPWPIRYTLPAEVRTVGGCVVTNHAGTFSAQHLDIGTRFFLDHLPGAGDAARIVDLGCGNGVLGMALALTSPNSRVDFVDESYLAIESARATISDHLATDADLHFAVADSLPSAGIDRGSVDLVVTNPPFHLIQGTTDSIAWQMFTESRNVLRRGGELWVVGNRHLGYHAKLHRIFGNCTVAASGPKFVVLRSCRT